MPDGLFPTSRQCALPGCVETFEQLEDGGTRRLYCTDEHRRAARTLRRITRYETGRTPGQVVTGAFEFVAPHPSRMPESNGRPSWIADPFSLPRS